MKNLLAWETSYSQICELDLNVFNSMLYTYIYDP